MKFDDLNVDYHIRERGNIALMISSFQPNQQGSDLLRVALNSMIKFKRKDASIWVIDVGSPESNFLVTPDEYPTVNFVITDFTPRSWESSPSWKRIIKCALGDKPPRSGSYANGWTLDFGNSAFEKIEYVPEYFMTLQMDVMFTRENLLDELLKLFDENTAAVGVRQQLCYNKSEEILHSLGCLWKTDIFNNLHTSFMNEFPSYDVGEKAVVEASKNGYQIKNLRNTITQPETNILVKDEEIRNWHLDKVLDEENNVIFMHLGRGIAQSEFGMERKIDLEDWKNIYRKLCEKNGFSKYEKRCVSLGTDW